MPPTNLINASTTRPGSTTTRTWGARMRDHVNVKDFGAVGDNVTDDTAAIQAAIDYAFSQNISVVYMPSGRYRVSEPIWLDPPGNARVDITNPPDFNFNMHLIGDYWGGGDYPGTYLESTVSTYLPGFDFTACLFVGPGQFMGVEGIYIECLHNLGTYGNGLMRRYDQIAGVCMVTSGGGTHVTVLDRVAAAGCYDGFRVGAVFGSLGDSTTLIGCQAKSCYYGFDTRYTQNFINALNDCTFQDCLFNVYSNSNLNINVTGGNYSGSGAQTVYAVSAGSYNAGTQEITFHVDSALDWNQGGLANIGYHDIFAIETPHTGTWALTRVSWNSGTGNIVMLADGDWMADQYNNSAIGNIYTDISNILSGVTRLYGADRVTVFGSTGIFARGVHIETLSPTRLCLANEGWNVGSMTRLDDIYINSTPQSFNSSNPDSYLYGMGVLGAVWPFIENDMGLIITNLKGPGSPGALGTWRISGNEHRHPFFSATYESNIAPTSVYCGGFRTTTPMDANVSGASSNSGASIESYARGFGDFDRAPWAGFFPQSSDWQVPHVHGVTRSPYVGRMPAPWVVPRLWPQTLNTMLGSLPALADKAYPPVCGDTLYSVSHIMENILGPTDIASLSSAFWSTREMFVRFSHMMFSWGQPITCNWSHRGGIRVIHVDDASFLFPGLIIGCDYGGTVYWYLIMEITNIGTTSADIHVIRPHNFNTDQVTNGVYATTYTGTQFLQQPFSITPLGNMVADSLSDAWVTGLTFRVGDRIWQRTPVSGGSMGWICTTAGVAGSSAVFKAMPNLA